MKKLLFMNILLLVGYHLAYAGNNLSINNQSTVRNIWYFAPNGTQFKAASILQDGTHQHPYDTTAFKQTTVDAIHKVAPIAKLYLAPGQYQASNNKLTPNVKYNPLILNAGQSIWGRRADFKLAIADNTQVNIVGSIELINYNSLNDMSIYNNKAQYAQGIEIDGRDTSINHVQVGTQIIRNQGYNTGLINYGHATINHSIINSRNSLTINGFIMLINKVAHKLTLNNTHYKTNIIGDEHNLNQQQGFNDYNSPSLGIAVVKGNIISNIVTHTPPNHRLEATYGIHNFNTLVLDHSIIHVQSKDNAAIGLANQSQGNVILKDSNIKVSAINNQAFGIRNSGKSSKILLNHSKVVAYSNINAVGLIDIAQQKNSVMVQKGSQITGIATINRAQAVGFFNQSGEQAMITDSDISAINNQHKSANILKGLVNINKSITTLDHAKVNTLATGNLDLATGIENGDNSLMVIQQGSTLKTTANSKIPKDISQVTGLYNRGEVIVKNSRLITHEINANNNDDNNDELPATGIDEDGNGDIRIFDSKINVLGSDAYITGIKLENHDLNGSTAELNHTQVTATLTNTFNYTICGVDNRGRSFTMQNNALLKINSLNQSNSGAAYGICDVFGQNNITVNDSVISTNIAGAGITSGISVSHTNLRINRSIMLANGINATTGLTADANITNSIFIVRHNNSMLSLVKGIIFTLSEPTTHRKNYLTING